MKESNNKSKSISKKRHQRTRTLAREYDDLEECIEEKDAIRRDARSREEHWGRGPGGAVGVQRGLNHDETVADVLTEQRPPSSEGLSKRDKRANKELSNATHL